MRSGSCQKKKKKTHPTTDCKSYCFKAGDEYSHCVFPPTGLFQPRVKSLLPWDKAQQHLQLGPLGCFAED